tara:strand:- start:2065 stop:2487 length:423 start_codon:yes stop_codon:yes gene_type:complete
MFNDDWDDSGEIPLEDGYDPKKKYYKNYLIMGQFFFKIQEAAWWFVAELEDALYPYRDREITQPLWAEGEIDVDELSYLKSQMESANQRIERLQSEMIFVQSSINSLSDKRKFSIKSDQIKSNEGQESSKTANQTSKETS